MADLRDRMEAAVLRRAPDAVIFSRAAARLPNTAAFAVPGVAAETALIAFDLAGLALSSGSACSSGKVTPSAALLAMGHPPEVARAALRVSIGPSTPAAAAERFDAALGSVIAAMPRRSPFAA